MRTLYLIIAFGGTLALSEPCVAGEPTGSDVRAVLDGKYALTAEVYADYQKCISSIPLGTAIPAYKDKVSECKNVAKKSGYVILAEPPEQETTSQTLRNATVQMQRDRAWQSEKLQSVR